MYSYSQDDFVGAETDAERNRETQDDHKRCDDCRISQREGQSAIERKIAHNAPAFAEGLGLAPSDSGLTTRGVETLDLLTDVEGESRVASILADWLRSRLGAAGTSVETLRVNLESAHAGGRPGDPELRISVTPSEDEIAAEVADWRRSFADLHFVH